MWGWISSVSSLSRRTEAPNHRRIRRFTGPSLSVLEEFEPGCGVTPTLTTGGTDSRFFREIGSVCYGFQPMIPDEPNDQLEKRMHGIDERITIENLVYGTSVLYETVKRFVS